MNPNHEENKNLQDNEVEVISKKSNDSATEPKLKPPVQFFKIKINGFTYVQR